MITVLCEVPIFLRHVVFIGDCSQNDAEDWIYKLRGKRTRCVFAENSNGGVRDVNGDIYVWVKDTSFASIVAHELAHVACTIMEVCHIPQCRDTEELMCYLIGWLKINVQDKVYEKKEKATKKRRTK